jgi:hypothetical protein
VGKLACAVMLGLNLCHRSVETVRGYVRGAEIFKDHAGADLL